MVHDGQGDPSNHPPILTAAQIMYNGFYSYLNVMGIIEFLGGRGLVLSPNLKDDEGQVYAGTRLVKHYFDHYAMPDKEVTTEQASKFEPFFFMNVFCEIAPLGLFDTDRTEELENIFKSPKFQKAAANMLDYYLKIEPFLHKELDKLYKLHPELKENHRVQFDDLRALVFPYKDLPENELEPLFEKCRSKATIENYKGGAVSYHQYFEYIYAAIKAARKSVDDLDKPAKPKKKKTQPKNQKQTFSEIQANGLEKQEALNAGYIPSSSGIYLLYRILIAGKSGLGELPARLEKPSKNKKEVTINRKGQTREITQITPKGQDTIIFDVDHLLESRQNSPARKILLYSLSQMLQQALSNNNVIRDGVIISYQDMVDKRMYSDKKAAKRGLDRAFDLLSSIKVKGYITRGKGKIEQVKASVLFYDLEHTGKGSAILKINDTLNWSYIVPQYAMLPDTYYKLPPNAADLYYYIFNQARINIKKLTENGGKINISYKSIHSLLGLPTIENAANPTTQIKNPIENAIGAIADSKQDALYIEAATQTEYNSIYEYLEKGYITAVINPDYLNSYMKKVKEWEKANLEAKKRRMKIEDTAKTKALQKKIEAAETDTQK